MTPIEQPVPDLYLRLWQDVFIERHIAGVRKSPFLKYIFPTGKRGVLQTLTSQELLGTILV